MATIDRTAPTWQRTHRIEAESPGSFLSEESLYTVSERSVDEALATLPEHVFRFRFYDVLTAEVEVEGEPQTVRKTENHSPWHYIGGSIYTVDEVTEINSATKQLGTLLANMRGNGWDRAIQTPLGNWHPWESDFVLVPQPVAKEGCHSWVVPLSAVSGRIRE